MEAAESQPARKTKFYDTAASFAAAPLLGRAYRMYASCPEFKSLGPCWSDGEGISIIVLPDGSGRLLISSRQEDNTVRHATVPLRLKGEDYEAQRELGIELREFAAQCVIHGRDSSPSSGLEARRLVQDFACDILHESTSDKWQLKLYPCLGGHTFRYEDSEDGELRTISGSDVMMTTPNCDELGHYFFRPTGVRVSSETVDAVVAEEVAAWDAVLTPPKLSAGDTVRVRGTLESASKGGGNLAPELIGTVRQIDEDGDAEVDFGAGTGVHYVLTGNFINLLVVEQQPRKRARVLERNEKRE